MGRGKKKKRQLLGPQQCALCGKRMNSTDPGCIVGATGSLVCAGCLHISKKILEASKENMPDTLEHTTSILTPQEIVDELDRSIIGQENAKRAVAVALWKQQLRAEGDSNVPRTNLLLYGPTGCGKTALVQEAAKIVGLPFIVYDATTLTEAGYRGNDAQDIVAKLLSLYEAHPKLNYGIILLDEVDKLAAQGSEARTAYNRGTQYSLLKILEGIDVSTDKGTFSTKNMLFIFGGAFSGIREMNRQTHIPPNPIGFMRENVRFEQNDVPVVSMESFIQYGMDPELMGRVGQQVALEALHAEELKKILLDSQISLYRQYQRFFLQHGVELEFTSARIEELVEQAMVLGTGARALNMLVEVAVEPLLFHLAAGRLQSHENKAVQHVG